MANAGHGGGEASAEISSFDVLFSQVIVTPPPSVWTGQSSTNWADTANWTGAVPGSAAGTGSKDTAYFRANAPNSPLNIDAGRNLQTLTFDTDNVNSLTVGLPSNSLLLTAGGTIQTTASVINSQTVNASLVLGGSYTLASNAANNSATLTFGGSIGPAATNGLTTLILDGSNQGANTISGALSDNGAGQLAVSKSGSGTWILSGANTYSGSTTVSGGTLKFAINSGVPTIAAGAVATVTSGATLELAGSVSALGSVEGIHEHIANTSTAPGLVVSGKHQQVGNIDGSGTTQVNAGSDLTANHIIQGAIVIDGTAGSHGLVTIAASDASGNPLDQPSGVALADSLTPSDPFGEDVISSNNLSSGGSGDPAALSLGNAAGGGNQSSVPEPSALLLVLVGIAGFAGHGFASRRRARRDVY